MFTWGCYMNHPVWPCWVFLYPLQENVIDIYFALWIGSKRAKTHSDPHTLLSLCQKFPCIYAIDSKHKCAAIAVRSKSSMRWFPFRSHSDIFSDSAVQGRNTIEAIGMLIPPYFPSITHITHVPGVWVHSTIISKHIVIQICIRNAIYK